MTIVDIYDALSIDRSYRTAMPQDKFFALLEEDTGKGKLDVHLVTEFSAMIIEQD